jgi:hypothetical protein
MYKGLLVVAAAIVALSGAPTFARFAAAAPNTSEEGQRIGIPIFTSDGAEIGVVTATGTDEDGHFVLLTELGTALGLNAQTVAIPMELLVVRSDRVDLLLSIEEIRQRLARANQERS